MADGEERHKRKFLTDIIYQESSERFVDLQTLKDIFPNLNVQQIHDILHETFKKHSCYINDFGYTNLTLHLAILLTVCKAAIRLSIHKRSSLSFQKLRCL